MEDNLVSDLVRFAAANIPGKEISVSIHYQDMKSKMKGDAKAKSISVEDYIEYVFKGKLINLENESKTDLFDIGIDIATIFIANRRFRVGWVIDGYWEIYQRCTSTAKITLDALTGL